MRLEFERPGSARAARTQFEQGFGDALITYEQDVLPQDKAASPRKLEIIYPRSTIFSEHTLVVINKQPTPADGMATLLVNKPIGQALSETEGEGGAICR